MKRIIFALLVVLLLSGCAREITDYTLPTASTGESTEELTASTSEFTEESTEESTEEKPYRQYATYPVEQPADHIIGNCYYYNNARIVSYYDVDLQRRVVLCSQPNCTHNSEDCTAFLGGINTEYQVVGDMVYAAVQEETQSGQLQVISLNLVTGERELLWEFGEKGGNIYIEYVNFSVDRTTAFLGFHLREDTLDEKYALVAVHEVSYAYALHLDTGEKELLFQDEIPSYSLSVSFSGSALLTDMSTEEFLLMRVEGEPQQVMSEEEYYRENPGGDYTEYLVDLWPESGIYSVNRATGEKTKICGDARESKRQDIWGPYRERKMSFAVGDTIYIYDGYTGEVTPCFTRERIALQMYKDGRIIYNICKENGGYDYYWYDLMTGETQQFQKGEDGMIFSLNEETADYFVGFYKGRNCYIHKQDFYNENYDAAF